jgi:Xaa-Pro aminopeptidase
MTTLHQLDLNELSTVLKQRGLDGWLVYDFHDVNPIARRMFGATGMLTRRLFLWLPAVGPPTIVVHNLDRPGLGPLPGEVQVYTTWHELHHMLTRLVRGRRIAMETSPENAVPYLDLVPSGVVELLGRLGATIVTSAPLVTRFTARWTAAEREDHRAVAEIIAGIARDTVSRVVDQVGTANEYAVRREVLGELQARELAVEDPPIVAFGPNASSGHYEPKDGQSRTLAAGDVVLLDLWARRSPHTVWADQTWMGIAGGKPAGEIQRAWEAVVDAREAVIRRLERAVASKERVSGAVLDSAAREVVTAAGFGEYFAHRTGHSIELSLHGSGPHLDDFETHDVRELVPGVGFSVEPGVYVPGRFGVRTEINVFLGPDGPEVTPRERQKVLIGV